MRVGQEGVEPSPPGYQPSVLPLNYRPVDFACPVEPGSMGPEGFEPPPTGLKSRHAAATPRPRSGHLVPGYAFDPDHRPCPRLDICQRLGASGLDPTVSSPRACGLARLSHALAIPASSSCGNRTHLSALKGRYPWPIDERASIQEWAGGRSNPRLPGFNRLLDRLSYRPIARFQQKSPVTSSHRA